MPIIHAGLKKINGEIKKSLGRLTTFLHSREEGEEKLKSWDGYHLINV